jgi:hypothetical protein
MVHVVEKHPHGRMPGAQIQSGPPEAGCRFDQLHVFRLQSGHIVAQGLALRRQILAKSRNSTQGVRRTSGHGRDSVDLYMQPARPAGASVCGAVPTKAEVLRHGYVS